MFKNKPRTNKTKQKLDYLAVYPKAFNYVLSSDLCGRLGKVPWKPEMKVKHATEANFEPGTEVHGEVLTQMPY